MSRFRSELSVAETRGYFTPNSAFSRKHPVACGLFNSLRKTDFHICEVVLHERHTWIRLSCGAILSIYETTGGCLVQGKMLDYDGAESLQMLRNLLPANTVWQVRVDY